ncbi:MAG: hypothetical protein U0802_04730 [Candidatus Binatia bacterium]
MARSRGALLGTLAVLIAALALSNFAKPIPVTDDTGFVLFGRRLAGPASWLAGAVGIAAALRADLR